MSKTPLKPWAILRLCMLFPSKYCRLQLIFCILPSCRRELEGSLEDSGAQDASPSEAVPGANKSTQETEEDQSRRCVYAVELLDAIRCFLTDFKDIIDQMSKGDKKKQKTHKIVNMAVETTGQGKTALPVNWSICTLQELRYRSMNNALHSH